MPEGADGGAPFPEGANGGVPVLPGAQLPYFFDEAASWCAPADEILAKN